MSYRIVNRHPVRAGAVFEVHLDRVADIAFVGIEVILRVTLVFCDLHFVAKCVNARVTGDVILVVRSRQSSKDHGHGNHVLEAVVAVGRIIEGPRLVDNAHARLLRFDNYLVDVIEPVLHLFMQRHGRFYGGLCMKFGRVGDLEEDIFHDIGAITLRERERIAVEQHVVITPGLRTQRRRITHFTGHRDERETHPATRRIARCPALARPRVRCMSIGAQRTTVNPGVRHGIDDLLAVAAQHARDHRGGCHTHQEHMVKSDAVVAVLQCQHALYLMRLDHCRQHILHRQRCFAFSPGHPAQIVGRGEDAAQVIGRVAPLRSEPGVVEVQPADHGADVERCHDGFKLIRRTGHPRTTRERCARDDGTE